MNDLIKSFVEKGLLFPVQAIIIAADLYFISKGNLNHYLLLSLILILSTIVLQAVKRRFMLLFPGFPLMGGRSSAHIDTYYLRAIFILSMLFFTLGVCLQYHDRFKAFDNLIGKFIPYAVVIFIIIVPIIFCWSSGKIREAIANKLKKDGPFLSLNDCPFCSSKSAIQENRVVDKNRIAVKTHCLKCEKSTEYEISVNIGE